MGTGGRRLPGNNTALGDQKNVEAVTNLLGALTRAKIVVNVDEDPRIKAWCIGSR